MDVRFCSDRLAWPGEFRGHQEEASGGRLVGLVGIGVPEFEEAPLASPGDFLPARGGANRLGQRPEIDLGVFLEERVLTLFPDHGKPAASPRDPRPAGWEQPACLLRQSRLGRPRDQCCWQATGDMDRAGAARGREGSRPVDDRLHGRQRAHRIEVDPARSPGRRPQELLARGFQPLLRLGATGDVDVHRLVVRTRWRWQEPRVAVLEDGDGSPLAKRPGGCWPA